MIESNIFKKDNFFYALICLIATFLVFPTFFILGLYPLGENNYFWSSLDPSWSIALKYSLNNGYTWGKDIAFTYGPLSHLIIRNGWESCKWTFLFFDIFLYLNFFIVLFNFIKDTKHKIISVFLIFLISLLIPNYPNGGAALLLLFLLAFWINKAIEKPTFYNYCFQITLIVLMFFIKFNTGLISLVLYYLAITYIIIFLKKQQWYFYTYIFIPLIVIYFCAIELKVQLTDYIISGFYIVSGYNDIMYINDPARKNLLYLAVLFIVLSLFIFIKELFPYDKKRFFKILFKLGLYFTCVFVLFKQAFVRADIGHALDFFKYVLLLIIIINDFTDFNFKSIQMGILFFITSIIIYVEVKEKDITKEKVVQKIDKKGYFNSFKSFEEESKNKIYPSNFPLPKEIITKIGKQTVDVFPWNIYLLLENNLNYKPRPVLQSYSCYNEYLQNLNFDFYNSENAPNFVIVDYETIDMRYAFFDEVKTNIVLKKRYDFVCSFEHNQRKMFLLERKKTAKKVILTKQDEYALMLNSPIIPKKDIFYQIEIYPTLKSKIYSVFRYSPELNIEIDSKGMKYSNRTSKSMLKAGIFNENYIKNIDDFEIYFKDSISNEQNKIMGYYIKPFDMSSYKDKIKVTEYKITQ
jgi:hypothetical protein